MAVYARGIGQEYADIVQHCSLMQELLIELQFGVTACKFQSKGRDCTSMHHVNFFQFIINRIVAVYYLIDIHSKRFYQMITQAKISKIEIPHKQFSPCKKRCLPLFFLI